MIEYLTVTTINAYPWRLFEVLKKLALFETVLKVSNEQRQLVNCGENSAALEVNLEANLVLFGINDHLKGAQMFLVRPGSKGAVGVALRSFSKAVHPLLIGARALGHR